MTPLTAPNAHPRKDMPTSATILSTQPASPRAVSKALLDGLPPAAESPVAGWSVRRVWPGSLNHADGGYVLELEAVGATGRPDIDGERRGATWGEEGVRVLEGDKKLPGLAPRIAADYRVIGHRPLKRAVVLSPEGTFVKLAKPRATHKALETMAAVEKLLRGVADAPGLPELVQGSTMTGVLELAPAPGRALGDVLVDASEDEAAAHAADLARVLVALAGVREPSDAPLGRHTLADEAAVLERWAASALAQAPLHPADREELETKVSGVAALLRDVHAEAGRANGGSGSGGEGNGAGAGHAAAAGNAGVAIGVSGADAGGAGASGAGAFPLILTHRDLHEGQILVDGAAAGEAAGADRPLPTILDWDTAAFAHPAADLANLLAHLDRLAGLGELPRPVVARFRSELLTRLAAEGHPAMTAAGREVLALLEESTRLRLIAVHGFRTPETVRAV